MGDKVQAFTAIDMLAGTESYEKQWAGTGLAAWARAADCTPITHLAIQPLPEHLSFVPNSRYRGITFRRGHFDIPQPDLELTE